MSPPAHNPAHDFYLCSLAGDRLDSLGDFDKALGCIFECFSRVLQEMMVSLVRRSARRSSGPSGLRLRERTSSYSMTFCKKWPCKALV